MAWMLVRIWTRRKQYRQAYSNGIAINLRRGARAVLYLFNLHTFIAVWLCAEHGWSFNMDFSMISTGTVFPLTFTLSQAFTRRERAASLIANLKASAMALYYMHRDWDQSYGTYPMGLGNDEQPAAMAAKKLLVEFLLSLRRYLVSNNNFESIAEARLTADKHEFLSLFEHDLHLNEKTRLFRNAMKTLSQADPGSKHLGDCYKWLSKLSVVNEKLTVAAGYTRGGEGGMSRTNQYLRYMMSNLEELRNIKEYRTPTMMRHACGVLIHIFAIALAPYFVHWCSNPEDGCAAGYTSSGAYVLIVMLLYHVQADMENCLSETGLDDTFFTVAEEMDNLAGAQVLRSARSSQSEFSYIVGNSPIRYASTDIPESVAIRMTGDSGHGDRPMLRTIPSDKALPYVEDDDPPPMLGGPPALRMSGKSKLHMVSPFLGASDGGPAAKSEGRQSFSGSSPERDNTTHTTALLSTTSVMSHHHHHHVHQIPEPGLFGSSVGGLTKRVSSSSRMAGPDADEHRWQAHSQSTTPKNAHLVSPHMHTSSSAPAFAVVSGRSRRSRPDLLTTSSIEMKARNFSGLHRDYDQDVEGGSSGCSGGDADHISTRPSSSPRRLTAESEIESPVKPEIPYRHS